MPVTEDSGRESWLKLVLLAVAFVLVAGYAAALTEMGAVIRARVEAIMGFGIPLVPIGAGLGAMAVGAMLIFLLRRRSRGGSETAGLTGGLPGAARRDEFLATLTEQIETHTKSGRQLAVHLIDIDRFHAVNQLLGEAEGNAFLRMVGERLLVLAGEPQRVARTGDDEFAVLQPEVGGVRHAEIYARRVEEVLKDVCAQIPRHARPGASIGVAVAPEHGSRAADLMHSASLALDAAKRAGGGTFRVFARDMAMAVEARLKMEKAISDGLHQAWFELNFQPQYDLRNRRLTGFEALVRMNHPELGEQLPDAFLPAAEASGLMQPLGEWIVRDALTAAARWPRHLALAINISTAQFRHGDIAGLILHALGKSELAPSRLRLEISEATLLDETSTVREQLRRLKARGITIVIDDFGMQLSRLKSLSRSSCDAVKLDRTLVESVGADRMRTILRAG